MNKNFVVITTIHPPTEAVRKFASWPGWTTVVVGDRKSPALWDEPNVVYLSLAEQKRFAPAFCEFVPENTYVRKMVGYLYAFSQGARAIFETDDDNIPYPNAAGVLSQRLASRGGITPCLGSDTGWVNIYDALGAKDCWPRGFPLHRIAASAASGREGSPALPWGVLQFLADEDPDVDAVYRMTRGTPVRFPPGRQLSLARGSFSPFNSQATLWVPETFPLMFLPLGVPDRVTDILRGYIALASLWANGMTLACCSPVVYQERNAHNLLNDFSQEIALYLHGDEWCRKLLEVKVGGMKASFAAALELLVAEGALPAQNLNAYSAFAACVPDRPK